MHEVRMPDPATQHLKNPKTQLVTKIVERMNPETGEMEPFEVTVREVVYEGEGEDRQPVMGGDPVWGLGCPGGCGRFWGFTPNTTQAGFRPRDPGARIAVDEQGKTTKGYLNWNPQNYAFICDRCGVEVKLVK